MIGVTETSQDAVRRASKLMDLRERTRAALVGKAKSAALLDALFINPYMTVAKAAKLLKVSNPTAREAVLTLEKEGILHEATGRKWGKIYLSRPIMKIIDMPATSNTQG